MYHVALPAQVSSPVAVIELNLDVVREPRSDELDTTCMHLVQMATRPLDQQVAELQVGLYITQLIAYDS